MTREEIVNELKNIHDRMFEDARKGMIAGMKAVEEATGKKSVNIDLSIIQSCCEGILVGVKAGNDQYLVGAAYAFAKEVRDSIIAEMAPEGLTGEKDEQ